MRARAAKNGSAAAPRRGPTPGPKRCTRAAGKEGGFCRRVSKSYTFMPETRAKFSGPGAGTELKSALHCDKLQTITRSMRRGRGA